MKLGRRWLPILWIASTMVWHQAGAVSASKSHASAAAQWTVADEDSSQPTADFALQGTADLEDQDLSKRPGSATTFIEPFAEIRAPELIVTGVAQNDFPRGISASTDAWRLIRGPPARA